MDRAGVDALSSGRLQIDLLPGLPRVFVAASLVLMHALRYLAPLLAATLALLIDTAAANELRPWNGGTPPLELKDLNGNTHRLADYRGNVVLINFWATWCEPCREEMPSIQQLKNKLAGKPFVVLAVNVAESEARIADYLGKQRFDFIVLHDRNSEAMKAWRVKGLPASFVVARDGRVRYSYIGEFDWATSRVVKVLADLLQPQ
jgi:thiol-disulfide isomerase/thioredoxin